MDPPRAVAGQSGDQARERLAAPLQIDAAPPAPAEKGRGHAGGDGLVSHCAWTTEWPGERIAGSAVTRRPPRRLPPLGERRGRTGAVWGDGPAPRCTWTTEWLGERAAGSAVTRRSCPHWGKGREGQRLYGGWTRLRCAWTVEWLNWWPADSATASRLSHRPPLPEKGRDRGSSGREGIASHCGRVAG